MKNMTLSGEMPGGNVIGRFVEGNRKMIVEVISALLILLFAYTSISKLLYIDRFIFVLSESPLINTSASIFAYSIPVIELIVSALLFVPAWRRWGFYFSFALMSIFTLYIFYMLIVTPNLPCSCGGIISFMTWKQHLIFNLLFSALAFLGIRLKKYE